MKRQVQVGDFIKYILDPKDTEGPYGLVFRIEPCWMNNGQAVWFGDKKHCQKYGRNYYEYSISGILYSNANKDCKIVSKPPKRILKRAENALNWIREHESNYYNYRGFTNLDLIEVLAKIKKLL